MIDETKPDVAAQPTITFWRWEVPKRTGCRPALAIVAAVLLVAAVAYGAGYARGTGSHDGTYYGETRAGVTPTATPSPWHMVWQHAGHGLELVTPPALDARAAPRFLLAWSCGTSKTEASMTVNISQAGAASVSLGRIRCPGYSSVQLAVTATGQDTPAHALHYGAYGVLVDVSGDAFWVVTVSDWRG